MPGASSPTSSRASSSGISRMSSKVWLGVGAGLLVALALGVASWECVQQQSADWFSGTGPVCSEKGLSRLGAPSRTSQSDGSDLANFTVGPHPAVSPSDQEALSGLQLEVLSWRRTCFGIKFSEAIAIIHRPTGRVLLFSFWQRLHGAGIIGPSPPLDMEESVRFCGPLPAPTAAGVPQ